MYTKYHFFMAMIWIPFAIAWGFVCWLSLRRARNGWVRKIPLMILAVFVIIIEVLKQYVEMWDGDYSNSALPFYICSIFLWLYSLCAFSVPNSKFEDIIIKTTFIFALGVSIIQLFFVPEMIMGDTAERIFTGAITGSGLERFTQMHTVIYHHLIGVALSTIIVLHIKEFKKKDIPIILIIWTVYLVVSAIASYLLHVNYPQLVASPIPLVEEISSYTTDMPLSQFNFLSILEVLVGLCIYVFGMYVLLTIVWISQYYIIHRYFTPKMQNTPRNKTSPTARPHPHKSI
jgi:drug/metabolite transporter superfamily protein YnfA